MIEFKLTLTDYEMKHLREILADSGLCYDSPLREKVNNVYHDTLKGDE